ncbi:MAG: hypothetical protein KF689_14215 [Gemmatimonadaceae bacterium]|nr:hypothetical protein [Gemmatimonadaceae bacterium]MCW5826858.1 hypothetical protein [Gemmatimonadaceae bacterium]
MPSTHDADEAIAKQHLHLELRGGHGVHDAGLEIYQPVAQWPSVLAGLLNEAQTHARSGLADARDERGP